MKAAEQTLKHYLTELVLKHWDDLDKRQGRVLHFQGTGEAFSLFQDFFHNRLRFDLPFYNLGHGYDRFRPYAPFLTLLRDRGNGNEGWEDLFDEAGLLSFHRPFFRAWLTRKDTNLRPLPFMEEVNFEKQNIRDAVTRLLEAWSRRRPLVLAIANSQKMQEEALEILRDLTAKPGFRGLILLHFHSDSVRNIGPLPDFLQDYYHDIGVHDTLFSLDDDILEFHALPQFAPATADIRTIAETCATFLCFGLGLEAVRTAVWEPQNQSEKAMKLFFEGLFLAHLEPRKTVEAALNLEEAASCFAEAISTDPEGPWTAESYFHLAQVAIDRQDYPTAQAWSRKAVEVAGRNHEPLTEARALLLDHIITHRRGLGQSWDGWHKAVAYFEQAGWQQLLIFSLWNFAPADQLVLHAQESLASLDRAIQLAEACSHDFALSAAYHLKGILVSQLKGEAEALPFYEKGLAVRQKLGQTLPLIRIQNGLGFALMNQADFAHAFRYLKKAIVLLDGIRDFFETALTLFNLAMVYFFGRNFDKSLFLIHRVLRIMQILELRNLVFHNLPDVHLFRVFCTFKIGDDVRALGILGTLEKDLDRLNPFNLPVFHCLKALMAEKEGQYDQCRELFHKARQAMPSDQATIQRLGPFLALEEASGLMARGLAEDAQDALDRYPVQAPNNLQYPYWYRRLMETQSIGEGFTFPPLDINLEGVVDLARQEKKLKQFYKNLKDIKFVNTTMNTLADLASPSLLCQQAARELGNHYPTSDGCFWSCTNGRWTEETRNLWAGTPEGDPLILWDKGADQVEILYPADRPASVPEPWRSWTSLTVVRLVADGQPRGLFVWGTRDFPTLSSEDSNILTILAGYLASRLSGLQKNSELQRIALSDSLTGLANRKAFQEKIDEESRRIRRYGHQHALPSFALIFFDLDNFKYYNDTFGHRVGDLVLGLFAGLLQEIFRDTDFLARYGGDEFVVMMPETPASQARAAAERLLSTLRQREGFLSEIQTSLGRPVHIPPEYSLSASVGISEYADLEPRPEGAGSADLPDLESLVTMADKALYQVKATGKGGIRLYQELSGRLG